MTNNITSKHFNDFKEQYSYKYSFESDKSLGDGSYGVVFKAKDIDRNIDVAIKFYLDGLVPTGSERGWNLSTKTINHQIAPTYTIENFTSDGKEFKAVVSRFIPGKSLKDIFTFCNKQSPEDKLRIGNDLAFSFFPSLLDVLELCHSLGFGHGDLHEGNVMVFPKDLEKRYSFSAVLIDFDNSSIEKEAYCPTEKEKIEKDIRLFTTRLAPYILLDWEWHEETKNIFTNYTTIRDIRIAFDAILKLIDMVTTNSVNKKKTLEILGNLVQYQMNRFTPKATLDTLNAIATKSGMEKEFGEIYSDFQERLRDTNNFTYEVTFIENGQIRNDLYKKLFGL